MTATQPTTAPDPFVTIRAPGNVEVHVLSTDRFKTVRLAWVLEAPVDTGASARALLPDLLTRGTSSCPDLAAMAARCEDLYGCHLQAHVGATGPRQFLHFGVTSIADRLAGCDLFEDVVTLLDEVLHDPPLVDGSFRADHVEQERTNLVRAIEGLDDDKHGYAFRQLMAHMHAGTPWARHAWGTAAEARALTVADIHAAWTTLLESAPVRFVVVGDVTPEAALAAAERLGRGRDRPLPAGAVVPPEDPGHAERREREVQPLSQSKLAMGLRVGHDVVGSAAAPLYGVVLGGGGHSRLFKRVREAESLAYGCSAAVLVDSASLLVQAGVDADNADRTAALVHEEITRLAEHGVSEDELELSKRAQLRRLSALVDDPRGWSGFRVNALVTGRPHRLDEALARVAAVTPEDIAAVAAGVHPDSLFLLEGRTA